MGIRRSIGSFAALVLALAASACAGGPQAPSISAIGGASGQATVQPASHTIITGSTDKPGSAYKLSDEEKDLSCKKLTGRMQVRILQIRDYKQKPQTSELSRGMRSIISPILSGTPQNPTEGSRYQHDRAVLEAYNRRLAEMKCRVFNLDAELQPKPVRHTPEAKAAKPRGRN